MKFSLKLHFRSVRFSMSGNDLNKIIRETHHAAVDVFKLDKNGGEIDCNNIKEMPVYGSATLIVPTYPTEVSELVLREIFFNVWCDILEHGYAARVFQELTLNAVAATSSFESKNMVAMNLAFSFTDKDGNNIAHQLSVETSITSTLVTRIVAPTISSPKLLPIPYKPAHESLRQ